MLKREEEDLGAIIAGMLLGTFLFIVGIALGWVMHVVMA